MRLPFLLAGLTIGCALLALTHATAHAQADTGLRIHGFGTVGVTAIDAPDDWGMRRSHKQRRNDGGLRMDVDSRLGLQANYALGDEVEMVGQAVLQPQVRVQPVELAFVAWRPRPDLTLRLGRTNNDVVLLSESRNIGFSYLWVRPNHDAYGPLPIYLLDGIDATWQHQGGGAHWKVHAFAGRGSTTVDGATGQRSQRYDIQRLAGLTVSRDQGGLHLRGTVAAVRAALGRTAVATRALQTLGQVAALPLPTVAAEAAELREVLGGLLDSRRVTYVGAGLAFDDGGPWIATVEVMRALSEERYISGRFGYASLGRRIGPVTVYGTAGVGRFGTGWQTLSDWTEALAPLAGPEAARAVGNAGAVVHREVHGGATHQHSVSVGLRWDLHPRAALKLQLDRFSVERSGSLFWTTGEARSARPVVGSVVLDFIF
ncbi:MAG: hypothetical protein ACK4PH_07085 [Aquincola tertiaricarbonis]